MAKKDSKIDEALEGLDEGKRGTLTKLIKGSAFAAPIVASFAMQGLSIRPADAATPGSSASNATLYSDSRLKREVARVGTHAMGFGIYRFKYLWSDVAYRGVLAQEVRETAPHAVVEGPRGFLAVDYAALGLQMTRETAQAR